MPNVEAVGQSAHLASDEPRDVATSRTSAPRVLAELLLEQRQTNALLLELIAEVRGLRGDLSRQPRADGLIEALRAYFGPGTFTVAGLLEVAASDPHCALADAVAAICPSGSAHGGAIALGRLLSSLPDVEVAAARRGVQIYRLLRE